MTDNIRRTTPLTRNEVLRLQELYSTGISCPVAAARIGITRGTVWRYYKWLRDGKDVLTMKRKPRGPKPNIRWKDRPERPAMPNRHYHSTFTPE